ncbi:MAG: DNA polymerase I [Methylococcales bacterium]
MIESIENDNLLVLIDGSSFLYRAFHALPPLTNSSGEPTGAILGVSNMLRKLLDQYPTPYLVVVFDAPGKTFRNELFDAYKANRPPMPDELRTQIEPLRELITAMGIPQWIESGVEADDVIGTLALYAEDAGLSVLISTGDKDMAQLVNDKVTLENTMSDTRMDSTGVLEKFGVTPAQIVDFLALVGDTSDNIPGVPKVGPKTAAKWLNQYGDIDNLIAKSEEIKGKVGENLRASIKQIPLSRQLATIKCDLQLTIDLDSLKRQEYDTEKLAELLTKFEFSSWLKQLNVRQANSPSDPVEQDSIHYETILSREALTKWLAKLENSPVFAFDTETTSLNYSEAEVVGVSFAVEPGEAAYLPMAHQYPEAPEQLNRDKVFDLMRPLLEDASHPKLGQNLKYDANVLANHNITLRGIHHDTMLQSYVLNSTATRHDMDSLAMHYLGRQTIHYEDVAGKGAKQISFDKVPLDQAGPYAAEDADITLRLHHHLWPQLEQQPALKILYEQIEIPLIPVLSRIERTGVLIDKVLLVNQSEALAIRISEIEQQAFDEAGQSFNLGSPKQIQSILYEDQGLPILKKTPKGQPSTAESVLQDLAADYSLPKLILEYRSMSKLKSTYTDRLPEQISHVTGRVHTSYHQAVAATGRLSSSNPNLQNIPIRTEEGRKIRQAFIAPDGHKILAADYSQIELRIMAHLSKDAGLLEAFSKGEDIHRATAAEVFGVIVDQITNDQRRSAKAINFGLIYGMSAFGLAKQLGIARDAAQQYIDLYFARYPGVKTYMTETREQAREQGFVETLFGRRLYLPDIHSKNAQRRQYAERTAINAPMQGTAADIIKRAMISVDNWLQKQESSITMIMQVHDELVFEIPHEIINKAADQIRDCMVGAAELHVPLVVDIGSGLNWDQAH